MDKKEHKKEQPSTKDDGKVEKVVYKIVHVPYYYPVPVDVEWYYKHQEQYQYPHENGFPFLSPDHSHYDHFIPSSSSPSSQQAPIPLTPPPGYPFPMRRSEYRDYHNYRDRRYRHETDSESCEYNDHSRSVSPTNTQTSIKHRDDQEESVQELSKANSPAVNGHGNSNISGKENNKVIGIDSGKSRGKVEEKGKKAEINGDMLQEDNTAKSDGKEKNEGEEHMKQEAEDDEDESLNDTASEKSGEVNRKRKRYLMSFPYDQRKNRVGPENGDDLKKQPKEDEDKFASCRNGEDVDENERKYKKSGAIPSDHDTILSPHVPYVMVPMRSSHYISPEIRYEPRYPSSKNYPIPYETRNYERTNGHNGDKELRPDDRKPSSEKEDRKQGLRFHPNGRRARTVFTRQQLLTLNNIFEKHPFVSGERMSELSDQLGLDRKIVKIWFQNKRQYARKKGSLVERDEDYYFDYPEERYTTPPPPTMAERWKH